MTLDLAKHAVVDHLVARGWRSIEHPPFTAIASRQFETATVPKDAVLYWYTSAEGCTLVGEYVSEGRNVLATVREFFRADDAPDAVSERIERFLRAAQHAIDTSYARRLHLLDISPSVAA